MCGIDPDTLTLDGFVGLIAKIDLLRLWQSPDERIRNGISIYTLQREMAVAKQAGESTGMIGPPLADPAP